MYKHTLILQYQCQKEKSEKIISQFFVFFFKNITWKNISHD